MPQDESWSAIDEKIKEIQGKKTLEMHDYRPKVVPSKTSKKKITRKQIEKALEEYLDRGGTIKKINADFDLTISSNYLGDK